MTEREAAEYIVEQDHGWSSGLENWYCAAVLANEFMPKELQQNLSLKGGKTPVLTLLQTRNLKSISCH